MYNIVQKCIVAYIDILGYKHRINQAFEKNSVIQLATNIKNAIEHAIERNLNNQLESNKIVADQVFSYHIFSDSVIISSACTDLRDELISPQVFHALYTFSIIQFELLQADILIRGGISIDQHYEDGKVVFSKALIKSYELEKKEAVYPRVVIDKELVELIYNKMDDGDYKSWNGLVKLDSDNKFFLDYLDYISDLTLEEIMEFLLTHKNFIEKKIQEDTLQQALPKYLWQARYHDYKCQYFIEKDYENFMIDKSITTIKDGQFNAFSVAIIFDVESETGKFDIHLYEGFYRNNAYRHFLEDNTDAKIDEIIKFKSELEEREFIKEQKENNKIKSIREFKERINQYSSDT